MLQEEFNKYCKKDKFASLCNLELVDCQPGYAKVQVKITKNHLNGAGIVHGGLLFTLADFCFGMAANSYGRVALTINSSINYIAKSASGVITAEAFERGKTNKLFTYDVDIRDENKTLLARFTGMSYATHMDINFDDKGKYQ